MRRSLRRIRQALALTASPGWMADQVVPDLLGRVVSRQTHCQILRPGDPAQQLCHLAQHVVPWHVRVLVVDLLDAVN